MLSRGWKRAFRSVLPVVLASTLGLAGGWITATRSHPTAPASGSGSLFFFPDNLMPSLRGKAAGAEMLRTLTTGDPAGCMTARESWKEIVMTENFGFEYGALDWLCEYKTASADRQAQMIAENADGGRVVDYFEGVGWQRLAEYLVQRYRLPESDPTLRPMKEADYGFVEELLCFGGPQRAGWEHPDDILRTLDVHAGMDIADLGAGTGYMTYRFSDAVGPTGHVYALDIFARFLALIDHIVEKEGRTNITTVHNRDSDLTMPADSVDLVWICNVYHQFYGMTREADRAALLQSIHATLRPGGRLVVLENTPEAELPPGVLYHSGHAISASLIIPQLTAYGFHFTARHDLIPQRYILEFEEP